MATPSAATRWAELRQVVLATFDHPGAVAQARTALALGPGFDDPALGATGLVDETIPIGPDTYLEIVAPLDRMSGPGRWLDKAGGAAGWVLSVQVPNLDGVQERCAATGVRVVVATNFDGHDIVQLHPKDTGILLELDAFEPRSGWFWDHLDGARRAQAARSPLVDDILAVDIALLEPELMARRWAEVIGLPPPFHRNGQWVVALGRREVRFATPEIGAMLGLWQVTMHASDRTAVGLVLEVCRTRIRLV